MTENKWPLINNHKTLSQIPYNILQKYINSANSLKKKKTINNRNKFKFTSTQMFWKWTDLKKKIIKNNHQTF